MAKVSVVARDKKRRRLVAKYKALRAELKKKGDYLALDRIPRNASPVRVRNRCQLTGRSRGYLRKFGLSRLVFRDMASKGQIPGIRKASW